MPMGFAASFSSRRCWAGPTRCYVLRIPRCLPCLGRYQPTEDDGVLHCEYSLLPSMDRYAAREIPSGESQMTLNDERADPNDGNSTFICSS
jgi:hypothetical protein